MRKEYEMTKKQLKTLLDACKLVPYIIIGGKAPRSPQENANNAWKRLGSDMGFDHMTVEPSKKGKAFFTAISLKEVEKWNTEKNR